MEAAGAVGVATPLAQSSANEIRRDLIILKHSLVYVKELAAAKSLWVAHDGDICVPIDQRTSFGDICLI
jgi:hypothetical protein